MKKFSTAGLALAALALTACSPVTVNTAPQTVTVSATLESTQAAAEPSPAQVTVTATRTEQAAPSSTAAVAPAAPTAATTAKKPKAQAAAAGGWESAAGAILDSQAAEFFDYLDESMCIENAAARETFWNNVCLGTLNNMSSYTTDVQVAIEEATSRYGAPKTDAKRDALRQVNNLLNKTLENVVQAGTHDCLVVGNPQYKIPRVLDGALKQCFYFYTNDYWTQAKGPLRTLAGR